MLGGTREAWLPYVIEAFTFFYDDILFLWNNDDAERLLNIGIEPTKTPLKHAQFWTDLRAGWKKRILSAPETKPPTGLVRYAILDALIASAGAKTPDAIENEIARHCMQASLDAGATEWNHFLSTLEAIEMSRSYFNPVEAIVDLLLKEGKFEYQEGSQRTLRFLSLLHQLGMKRTKLSEDFVLYSNRLKMPVYIQCKASGGGRTQHGKRYKTEPRNRSLADYSTPQNFQTEDSLFGETRNSIG